MSNFLPNRDGLLRSNLGDTIRRLKRIQKKAGKEVVEEEEAPKTGDLFFDIATGFIILVTKTKSIINKKNTESKLHGIDRIAIEDATAIRRNIQEMERMVDQLKKLVEDAEKEYKGVSKKKSSKSELLKQSLDEKRAHYQDALTTIDVVKEMNCELIAPGGSAETDISFGKKAQLREKLSDLNFSASPQAHKDPNEGVEGPSDTKFSSLYGSDQYALRVATVKENEEKIDAGLDRLRQGMCRLKDLSSNIGQQLAVQNQMLEHTEEAMTRQSEQLYNLTNRITKLIKESSPINTFMYCCCAIFIIAILGFILLQVGVI